MNHDTAPGRSAVARTADALRAAILDGTRRPGDILEGERALADQMGVSRLTLRAALTRLEAEGLVQTTHGSGTRVRDYREGGGVELLGHLVERALQGGRVPVRLLGDLLDLRRALAVEVLGLACDRATPAELAALRAQLAVLERSVFETERFVAEDLAFARLLVRASRNLALELFLNTVSRAVAEHPGLALAFRANAAQTLRVYSRLLELLEARDARRTRRVAARIVGGLDRRTLQRLEEFLESTSSSRPSREDTTSLPRPQEIDR